MEDSAYISNPKIADMISSLPYNIDETPDVINELRHLGVPEEYIDKYIIYPSGRPRTNMTFVPKIISLKRSNLPLNTLILSSNNDVLVDSKYIGKTMEFHQPVFIPVVRYIAGMTRSSLYHITLRKILWNFLLL